MDLSTAVNRALSLLKIDAEDEGNAAKVAQVEALGEQALDFAVGECNTDWKDAQGVEELPRGVVAALVDMIIWAYRREGSEGYKSESMGGNSVSFEDIPGAMRKRLYTSRLMRVW